MHSADFGQPGGEPGAWQGCKRAGHMYKAKIALNKGNSVLRNPVFKMAFWAPDWQPAQGRAITERTHGCHVLTVPVPQEVSWEVLM